MKNSRSKVRLFAKLCEDLGANYTSLLYCCEVRWLLRAKVIQRVLKLKEEIAIFLDKTYNVDANMFRDDNFIVQLAYLVEIFEKLSAFNESMQGPQIRLLIQKDTPKAFVKKIGPMKIKFSKK